MIVSTKLRFRSLREPYEYDMSDKDGPVGTSYSFEALDEDDAKVKVKCSAQTYEALKGAKRDDVIECTLDVFNPKISNGSPVKVNSASVKAA